MNILHLNTNPSGGSFEYARLLSDSLRKQGVQSNIVYRSVDHISGLRRVSDRLLRRIYVDCSRTAWHPTWRLLPPPSEKIIREVDIIHLHTVADWFDVPRWLLNVPKHIGVVISLHDLWHVSGGCFIYRGCEQLSKNCQACPILKFPANQIFAIQSQSHKLRAYQKCKAQLVANSQWLANVALQSPLAKACNGIKVISPSIETDIFKHHDQKLCRQTWNIPLQKFVILTGCTSLTDDNKNTLWLLRKLTKFSHKNDILIIVFGDGNLPAPVGINISFVGPIHDRLRLAQLMAAADVFVSASKMETYGLTLVEAMSCGTPVVAFKVGGIPEAVPEEYGSLLVSLGDSEALIQAILKLQESHIQLSTIMKKASDFIRRRNCPAVFAKSYLDLYEQHLAGRSSQL